METKTLKILIVLFFIALFAGCKEEAEVTEPNFVIEITPPAISDDIVFTYEHNGVAEEVILDIKEGVIVCNQSPKKAIEIIFKTLCKTYNLAGLTDLDDIESVRFEEPNEPKLTYTKEELDEIYKDEPALGMLAKRLWGFEEPNEPIATKIYEGQTFYDKREGIEPEKRMWIFDGNEFRRLYDIEFDEPDE